MYQQKGYKTFELYCKKEWEISRTRAYELMDSARKALHPVLSAIADKIKPSHFKPLMGMEYDESAEVLKVAVETAPEGKVTERLIQEIVDRREGEEGHDVLMAHHYTIMAINQLKKIDRKDPSRRAQGFKVINWCKTHLTGGKYHE